MNEKVAKSVKKNKASALKKLRPKAELPNAAVQRRLGPIRVATLERLLSEELECVFNESFRRPTEVRALFEDLNQASITTRNIRLDDSIAGMISPAAVDPDEVLTASEERTLFLRYNYCRYRVMQIMRKFRGIRLTAAAAREALRWNDLGLQTRSEIVQSNTSLVMAMARRSKHTGAELNDLISEGNLALLRCVDKFDCGRGFKFSTYACRAILASFSRASAKSTRYRVLFPTSYDPAFERSDELERKRESDEDECVSGLKSILTENLADLSGVEQSVISARFALDKKPTGDRKIRGKTLEQVGAQLGVSKERVRQIQNRALAKLRDVLEGEVLAAS